MSTSFQSEGTGFISEFRYPTQWYSKLVVAVLAIAFFTLLATGAIAGYLVYRVATPAQSHSDLDFNTFPGHPQKIAYSAPSGEPRDAWFFPGLKSAPTVILCPGYESSRSELLTMASALQDHQYNVLLFDFSAQGSSGGHSTLGYQELAELRGIVDMMGRRDDVDNTRFGVWGANLGAHVALSEAIGDPRVRAVAADSAYGRPADMVGILVRRSGLGTLPFVTPMTERVFDWFNYQYRNAVPLTSRMNNLTGVAQLYIESADDPALSDATSEVFRLSPAPHELVVLPHGNYTSMVDDDKRAYENRIVSFFLVNLPPVQASLTPTAPPPGTHRK